MSFLRSLSSLRRSVITSSSSSLGPPLTPLPPSSSLSLFRRCFSNDNNNSDDTISTRIHISGIPYHLNSQLLSQAFSPFGQVISSRILYDRVRLPGSNSNQNQFSFNESGRGTDGAAGGPGFQRRSRGIGFIEFTTPESVQKAIEGMNGKTWREAGMGRNNDVNINVNNDGSRREMTIQVSLARRPNFAGATGGGGAIGANNGSSSGFGTDSRDSPRRGRSPNATTYNSGPIPRPSQPSHPPSTTVYIGNIPYTTSPHALRNFIASLPANLPSSSSSSSDLSNSEPLIKGAISDVRMPINRQDGSLRGFGYIEFQSLSDAQRLIEVFGPGSRMRWEKQQGIWNEGGDEGEYDHRNFGFGETNIGEGRLVYEGRWLRLDFVPPEKQTRSSSFSRPNQTQNRNQSQTPSSYNPAGGYDSLSSEAELSPLDYPEPSESSSSPSSSFGGSGASSPSSLDSNGKGNLDEVWDEPSNGDADGFGSAKRGSKHDGWGGLGMDELQGEKDGR